VPVVYAVNDGREIMLHIVRVNCTNDVNDNPRRGWIVMGVNGSHAPKFINEGCESYDPLYRYLGDGDRHFGARMCEGTAWVSVNVSVREFKRLSTLGSDI
jgi:hypothetical protein